MDRSHRFILSALGLLIAVSILYFSGILSVANQPLNEIVAGTPDKSCAVDSDCALRTTYCGWCDCGDAVNKNWNKFCLVKLSGSPPLCKMCAAEGYQFDVKCIKNQCAKVWK